MFCKGRRRDGNPSVTTAPSSCWRRRCVCSGLGCRGGRQGRRSQSLAHPWGIKSKEGEDPAVMKPSWSCSSFTHRSAKAPTKAALEQAELVEPPPRGSSSAPPAGGPKIFVKRRLRVKASAVCNHRQLLLLTSLQQQQGGVHPREGRALLHTQRLAGTESETSATKHGDPRLS